MTLSSRAVSGFVAVTACAAWALWPPGSLEAPGIAPPGAQRPAAPAAVVTAPLDTDAFRAPLWVIPPPPPEPEKPKPPPPPPPPLKLQLISIMREAGEGQTYSAVFYDPEKDKLVTIQRGAELDSARRVRAINSEGVVVEERSGNGGAVTKTLRLRDANSGVARGSP